MTSVSSYRQSGGSWHANQDFLTQNTEIKGGTEDPGTLERGNREVFWAQDRRLARPSGLSTLKRGHSGC